MKPLTLLTLSCLTIALFPSKAAAEAALSEAQKESIIKRLEQLLERREAGATSGSTIAISRLKTAAASESAAVGFYIDCIKLERFERDEKKGGEFSDWKQSHSDSLRSDAVKTSLRAHAIGLAAALQVAAADKAKPEQKEAAFAKALPDVYTFLDLASAGIAKTDAFQADRKIPNFERVWKQVENIKKLALFDSEIANALNISAYINIPDGYPEKLGGALGATESFILPRLYKFKNLTLIDEAWDRHIKRLADGVSFYKKEKLIAKSKDLFEEKLPLARWAQARDRFRYGTDKIAGSTAMLEVIKTHLDHEFCVSWIEEFRELVQEDAPESAPL